MSLRAWLTLLGLILIGLVLFFAAAKADEAKPEQKCITDEKSLLADMAENGVKPAVSLTGAGMKSFLDFISEANGHPIDDHGADHVLIFHGDNAALVAWFRGTCMIGYGTGPWAPLAEGLGIEKKEPAI